MKEQMKRLAKIGLLLVMILQFFTGCASNNTFFDSARVHEIRFAQEEADKPNAVTLLPDKKQKSFDEHIQVELQTNSGVLKLTLQDYLAGVLYAELPADFSIEAKKALAVAARTVALKKQLKGEAICDDPGCCQAWLPQIEYGQDALQALRETDGQILYYDGELIEATYFSCSGGMTEAAVEVWGNEVAYLQAVESPGEEAAPRFAQTITVALHTVQQSQPEVDISVEPFITDLVETAGEGVRTVKIGGVQFTGLQLRKLFDLPSTRFVITSTAQSVRFRCLGFGHRVGMSQYGADAMAREGADYAEILSYYYPGTEIKNAP